MRLEVEGEEIAAYGDVGGRCLLLHGAGEDASLFAAQLADVPGTWAIDLPGHGRSGGEARERIEEYAELVLGVLRRSAKRSTLLGGHSMGGAIALTCALTGPQHLAGLVLVSTGGRLRVHKDLLGALEESDEMPEAFRRLLVAPGADGALLGSMAPARPGALRRDFLACDRFDVLSRLREIRLRTLVLVGSRDVFTPEKYARSLADALGGELVVVDGAGHTLPLEAPQAVSGTLSRFLSEG